jgi:putative transcriptional regulator
MKDENITTFRLDPSNPPVADWSKLEELTDKEKHAAARNDADAHPATEEQLARGKRTYIKHLRRRLGLTQEEFAARFQLPYNTVRDWEQGVREPDAAARNFLRLIAHNSEAVIEALEVR